MYLLIWIYRFLSHSLVVWLFRWISNAILLKFVCPLPLMLWFVSICHLPFSPSSACDKNSISFAQGYDLMFIRLWGTGHDLLLNYAISSSNPFVNMPRSSKLMTKWWFDWQITEALLIKAVWFGRQPPRPRYPKFPRPLDLAFDGSDRLKRILPTLIWIPVLRFGL